MKICHKKLSLILKLPVGKHVCVSYGLPLVLFTNYLNVQCFSVVVAMKKREKFGEEEHGILGSCCHLVFAESGSGKIPENSVSSYICVWG